MTQPRIVGIDSWSQATRAILLKAQKLLGQGPAFHGRYFHGEKNSAPEFNNVTHEAVLAEFGVRVLPVLRQTNRVGLSHVEGRADGILNARDIIDAFGEEYMRESCGHVSIFLDVEGNGASHLSRDYYLGLSEGLESVARDLFLLGVYGIPGDTRTWGALASALDAGAKCCGTWLSHPYVAPYVARNEPIQWTPSMLKPYPLMERVPPIVWQYCFPPATAPADEQFDRNIVNPAFADASGFLKTLPLTRVVQ